MLKHLKLSIGIHCKASLIYTVAKLLVDYKLDQVFQVEAQAKSFSLCSWAKQ